MPDQITKIDEKNGTLRVGCNDWLGGVWTKILTSADYELDDYDVSEIEELQMQTAKHFGW